MASIGAKYWKPIMGVLIGLAVVSSGFAAYEDLRPYPTKFELQQVDERVKQVAGRSCKNALSLLMQEKRDIERQLQRAIDEKNTSWQRTLQEQLGDVRSEIERVKRACGWA